MNFYKFKETKPTANLLNQQQQTTVLLNLQIQSNKYSKHFERDKLVKNTGQNHYFIVYSNNKS